ncbi:MAG: hypothetical protein M0P69_15780 [Bacteroidales bacterium]|nr:hypothetical protein [Bacteroidales bacterium]
MRKIDRLRRECDEWNQSQHDMLNPQSISTKIYSEEDPMSSTGVLTLGATGMGGGDLVVPDDVVDFLREKDGVGNGIGGSGFSEFLKSLLEDVDVEDVHKDVSRGGMTYYSLVFPGNKVISVSVNGEEGAYQLCVIYNVDEDERLIAVKDLKEGVFGQDMNVVPDVFPSDWFLKTVKDALGEFEEQDTEDDEDDEDDTENDSDEDTGDDEDSDDEGVVKLEDMAEEPDEQGSDQRRAMSAGGRGSEGSPRESLVRRKRFVQYGGRRFLVG